MMQDDWLFFPFYLLLFGWNAYEMLRAKKRGKKGEYQVRAGIVFSIFLVILGNFTSEWLIIVGVSLLAGLVSTYLLMGKRT